MSRFSAIGFWVNKGVLYEPDFQTYLDSLTTPLSEGQKTLLNTFYVNIKIGYNINLLSDFFDAIWFKANETAEATYKNLVKRLHDADPVNSPTWIQFEGVTGDGVSSYIDTNYKESQGVNYLPASGNCMMGMYCRSGGFGTVVPMGARGKFYNMFYNHSNNEIRYYPNSDNSNTGFVSPVISTYPQLMSMGRNDSLTHSVRVMHHRDTGYYDSVIARNYSGTADNNLFLLALNARGNPRNWFDGQISVVYTSKFIDQAKHIILFNEIETIMLYYGK